MRIVYILTIITVLVAHLSAQTPVGTWSDHLIYNKAEDLAVGSEDIYASTGSSILVFNREFEELRKLSKINGLTETGISTIGWSEENNTLIIAYTSTNVDLVTDNTIYNIPDISLKYIPGKKVINRIRTKGRYAYLAGSFGIVVIDLIKKEIYDTWKPGDNDRTAEVWDVTFGNDEIYAATNMGLFYADASGEGLSYSGNWTPENRLPYPQGNYNALLYTGNRLYANRSGENFEGDSLFVIGTACSLFLYEPGLFNRSLEPGPDGFAVSSGTSARYYSTGGTLIKTINSYSPGIPDIVMTVPDNNNIWIADKNSGLLRLKDMSVIEFMNLPGPVSNDAINITTLNGKTIICGGGVDISWNNLWKPFSVSVNENNSWEKITSAQNNDAMRAVIDPRNSNHFFISTWGTGLMEFENNKLIKNYTDANSVLNNIIPGKPYVRTSGMAMDDKGYLWITQPEVPGTIKTLKPDGTWIINPVTIAVPTVGDILITRAGHKWVLLPRGYGLFLLDDKGTPESFVDDVSKKIMVTDAENKVFSYYFSIAEDLDGNIWIGTDQGPVVYYSPERIFSTDLKAYRIKIPRNDGSGLADYMLGTETITAIAVDGANRKWIGTSGSGAYLLSPDGITQIAHYNESNSPLFSNTITSISVDNLTGNVWFATSKGVQSLRGDATEGAEQFTNVYAFPNPVREDFEGNLTITGLMKETRVSITDISGNLVYKTVSDGGQASWDLRTYNGQRVATGVYMAFCAAADGSQSCVIKVLVIR
ncbi:MAG TPA: hypothetical protein PKX27_06535 [Bacteroidales bacterium]|nr:hypothetical protein [Bacteroidales bacterium]HOX74520.1 hypothetical protein [Bacteroidales bacterium]HPM87618.1 hypothetical protein [Bacteroidales bacterium]HQM70078.1 hypothetical protein [Bacteroidales bacterium]